MRLVAVGVSRQGGDRVTADTLRVEGRSAERLGQRPAVCRALLSSRAQEHAVRVEAHRGHGDVVGRIRSKEELRAQGGRGWGRRGAAASCRSSHLHGWRTASGNVNRYVESGCGFSDQADVVRRLHRQFESTGTRHRGRPYCGVGRGVADLNARRHQGPISVEAHAGNSAIEVAGRCHKGQI